MQDGPELFVHPGNGILLEAGDQQGLVEALVRMSETCQDYNPEHLAEEIREKFGPEQVGKQFYDLYQSILQDQPHV